MNLTDVQTMLFSGWDVSTQLRDHVYRRSREAFVNGDRARDAVRDAAALHARRQAARAAFLDGIGGLPESPPDLCAEVTGRIESPGLVIEKIIFQSRPKHYVTANLYLPEHREPRAPAVLFLCGHHEKAKAAEEYQTVCGMLAGAGMVVLAMDPIGQGERFSYFDPEAGATSVVWGTREHDYAGIQCLWLGHSLARYFLHDAMRGMDYLCSRSEVDAGRVGVTGNSGGGTQTCMMMLADDRVAAAAPGTFVMSRAAFLPTGQAQDAEQIWPGFSAAGFDHEDFLICMAPRPVCVLAVEYDFFPIEGTSATVGRCRRFYEMTGKPDNLRLEVDRSTHHYTPWLADKAAAFFRDALGVRAPRRELAFRPLPPEELNCTRTGQVAGDFADAHFIHNSNKNVLLRNEEILASRPAAERGGALRDWLEHAVKSGRKPGPLRFRPAEPLYVTGLQIRSIFWRSQEDLINHGLLVRGIREGNETPPTTIAVWPEGTRELNAHVDWLHAEVRSGRQVLILDLSGSGVIRGTEINNYPYHELYGTLDRLNDDLTWLGDSLAFLRVFDVLRAIDLVEEFPDTSIEGLRLYGAGRHGVYAKLAAALDARVSECVCRDDVPASLAGFASERFYDIRDIHAIVMPGFLQHGDLADLPLRVESRSAAV